VGSFIKATISKLLLIFRSPQADLTAEAARSRDRYRRATLSSAAAISARIISLAVSLITIPLTLKYLGIERYGMWMTISSMVAMFSFADLGMSNGLVNLVADANGRDDRDTVRHATASAFWMLSIIAGFLLVSIASVYQFIPWYRVFNVDSARAMRESGPAVLALIACFAVNLPLGIVGSIQTGFQNGFITNLWASAGSAISLFTVLLAIHFRAGLVVLILGLSGAPVLASVFNAAHLFLVDRPWLLPRMRFFSRDIASRLLKTGLMFFCLQLAAALGYQSDNLVIAHLLGARMVASYAVPSRLFNILPLLIGIIAGPMWPAYADAVASGDGQWIRKTFKRTVIGLGTMTFAATLILVIYGNIILTLWVGPQMRVSFALLLAFGVRCVLSAYLQPLSFLLNGMGKLRAQAIIAILMSIFNLVLSILFVRSFGVIGAILGTVIAELTVVVIPETIIVGRVLKRLKVA
jgi:O-antigen/teichoic acid export membrane protein